MTEPNSSGKASESGGTPLVEVTFTFVLDEGFLDGLDDFKGGRTRGITTAEIAVAVVAHQQARHGYVHWGIER